MLTSLFYFLGSVSKVHVVRHADLVCYVVLKVWEGRGFESNMPNMLFLN